MSKPNGRTIYKALMKARRRTFWGCRAYVTVELPLSVVPPMPDRSFCVDWGKEVYAGHWQQPCEDGTLIRQISKLSSGPVAPANEDSERHFLVYDQEYESWSWWEGTQLKVRAGEIILSESLPLAMVLAEIQYVEWAEMYLHGCRDAQRDPVLAAFLKASRHAKTHYVELSGDVLRFVYSVKYFHRERSLRFSSDLKHAFRVAHEHGVKAKLCR